MWILKCVLVRCCVCVCSWYHGGDGQSVYSVIHSNIILLSTYFWKMSVNRSVKPDSYPLEVPDLIKEISAQ